MVSTTTSFWEQVQRSVTIETYKIVDWNKICHCLNIRYKQVLDGWQNGFFFSLKKRKVFLKNEHLCGIEKILWNYDNISTWTCVPISELLSVDTPCIYGIRWTFLCKTLLWGEILKHFLWQFLIFSKNFIKFI